MLKVMHHSSPTPLSYPASTVQPVLRDTEELFVTELIIMIHIKYLEDGVNEVTGQLKACCNIQCLPTYTT